MRINQKRLNVVVILVIIGAVGLVSVAGLFAWSRWGSDSPSEKINSTSQGIKSFQDSEHGFSFSYPEKYEITTGRIWGDKEQGGLEVNLYDPNFVSPSGFNESSVNKDSSILTQVMVINTDIDQAVRFTEFLPATKEAKSRVCGVVGKTIETQTMRYITDFRKDNLLFSIDTSNINDERRSAHDMIIKSFKCN